MSINKRYIIKVYELDGTFKKTISENIVTSDIKYTENINGGQGQLNIVLNEDFNSTNIEKSDFVEVNLFDSNFPTGKVIYTGIIEGITRIYNPNQNQVQLVCRGLGALLTRLFFEKTSSKTFSENKDPGDIVRDVIAYFNSVYTGNWLNDSGVTNLGSNTSIDFDFTTCFDAIENLAESAGFYFLIREDGTVVFKLPNATVSHFFTVGKDLQQLTVTEDTTNLKNKVFLDFDSGQATDEDTTSQNTRGKIETKQQRNDVTDQSTADATATNILDDLKNPKQKAKLQVNQQFILENIKPGDNIKIRNIDYSIDNVQIQKITYTPNLVTIELDEFDSIGTILNK